MRGRVDAIVIGAAIVTVSGAVALALWARLNASWPVAALAAATTAVALLILAVRQRRSPPPANAAHPPAGVRDAVQARAASPEMPPAGASAPVAPVDPDLHRRIESIENGLRAVARRCFELDQRMEALDRQFEQRGQDTLKAVAGELSLIGTVVRDLAEAVALHDAELFSGDDAARRRAAARGDAPEVAPPGERIVPNAPAARSTNLTIAEVAPAAPAAPAPVEETAVPAAPAAAAPEERPVAPAKPSEPGTSQTVRRALVSGGVDLFLHSVVSLPQRKVRLYEALGRVREPDGGFTESDAVAAAAAKLGLTAKLETDLFRSVCKVASHLAARERDVPVMCPVSLPTLREPAYFTALAEAAERDRQVPVRVVLRLRQSEIARIGVIEAEAMEAARGLGFRFALDGVEDLRLDARDLAGRGVRYVKVPARLLLAAGSGDAPTEIHPADLSDLLARHGLSLIASGVDNEGTAVEIQDFSPPLAQGPLFSGPRPVRGEVLTADPPARPSPAETPPPATAAANTAARASVAAPTGSPAPASGDTAPTAKAERLPLRAFLRRTTA